MDWLRKFLKGSASNFRIQSSNIEDGNWGEPRDLSGEALDGEREESHYATTLSSGEENEAEEDQRSGDGQSEAGDGQYYKTSHLMDEDDQLAEALHQSLVFNSNPPWEFENIFPHFPSFFPMDSLLVSCSRQKSDGSCEDDERCSSSNEPNDVENLNVQGEPTESEEEEMDNQITRIGSFSGGGRVMLNQMGGECHSADDFYGAASAKNWAQHAKLKSKHEDDLPAQSFQQNLAFESSFAFDIAEIFQPIPLSFNPHSGQGFRHPGCIHSYASDYLLTDHEVLDPEDHPIYQNIDKNHHHHHHPHPLCFVCGQFIPVDADGRPLFRQHRFWRQKYCRSHDRDGTPSCCGCKRLKPRGSTYSLLSDGQWLCPDCGDSAVTESRALEPLERDVRKFYECLDMKIHKRTIPLLLVNDQEMKKGKARCQKNDHHRPNQTVGRTTWEPLNICTTVEGKDHILVAHPRNLTIRVLKGFPWLFTGHTLAHEMLHAWFTLEGYHNLDEEVEEGLCEVLAHMWLDSQLRSMSKWKIAPSPGSDFQKSFAKFLQHDIESRTSKPYGTGFQKMKKATDMHGLSGTLDYIRMTGGYT